MAILPLFTLLAAPQGSPTKVLDAAIRAHRFIGPLNVRAVQEGGAGKPTVTFSVTTDAKTALVRMQESQMAGRGRSDRSFWFRANDALAYDYLANEKLKRKVPFTTNFAERALFVLGQTGDLLRVLLDGEQFAEYLAQYGRLGQWKARSNASGLSLVRDVKVPGGRNTAVLRFNPKSSLLTSLSVRSPEGSIGWRIEYLPVKKPVLTIPKLARSVEAFTVSQEPPKFRDGASKRAVEAMYTAYGQLRRATILVKEARSQRQIEIDGKKLTERNPNIQYAYDGKFLTIIRPASREFFRGETSARSVPEILSTFGDVMDPICRQMLYGRVPTREILGSEFRVSLSGATKTVAGVQCDVVSAASPRNQVTLMIRKDNHLLDAITSTVLDTSGAILGMSARRFRYLGLGQPISASAFVLSAPDGYRTRSLPTPKRVKLRS